MDVKQLAAGGIGLGYTYPEVISENGSHVDTNEVAHPVSLPSNIAAGCLLLVLFASDCVVTCTPPGGWTELFQDSNVTELTFAAWYRVATGGEGATITVATSIAQMTAHTSYQIANYGGIEVSALQMLTNNSPDPLLLTPSWGTKDALWFGVCAYDFNRTITGYPASYTNGRNDRVNDVQGCGVGSARRKLRAASEEAGKFSIDVLDQWIAATIGIKP